MAQSDCAKYVLVSSPFYSSCWGDSCVVFEPHSGNTHGMSRTDLLILESLRSGPKTFDELIATPGIVLEQNLSRYLGQLLEALENLGLIEIASGSDAR